VLGQGSGVGGQVFLAPAPPAPEDSRSDLYATLLEACGVTSVTSSARGAYEKAAHDLDALDVNPDEVWRRAKVFTRKWPNASLTPTALARRWGECARTATSVEPRVPDWKSDGLVYGPKAVPDG
jgi:hypothetical protein